MFRFLLVALILLCAVQASAQTVNLNTLNPATSPLDGSETLWVVQKGAPVRATTAQIAGSNLPLNIVGGTINSTAIGNTTPSPGTFNVLTATSSAAVTGTLTVTGSETISTTLGVTGLSTLGSLTVTGASTLASASVTGASTLASASVTGVASIGSLIKLGGDAEQGYDFQIPTTGFSITIAAGKLREILDPAGTLATGTITMPATAGIVDGQKACVSSSQTVTALTVSANTSQSIKNAPTTIAAGGAFCYIWRLANTTWYRIQ